MSKNLPVQPADPDAQIPRSAGAPHDDPIKAIIQTLRGRLPLAIALAGAGALVGAIAGYHLDTPKYKSEGLIRIAYSQPQLGKADEQSVPMTIFDAFLRAQELEMSSRSEVERALREPVWREAYHGPDQNEMARFAGALSVDHQPNSDLLHVTFVDADPAVAAAGVQAIINVYASDYAATEAENHKKLLSALDDQAAELNAKLRDLQGQSTATSAPHTPGNDLQLKVDELQKRLDIAQRSITVANLNQDPSAPSSVSTDEMMSVDPVLGQLLSDKRELTDRLEQLRQNGFLDNNREVRNKQMALAETQRHISDFALSLRGTIGELSNEYQQAREQLAELNNAGTTVDGHRGLTEQVDKDLADIASRANTVRIEDRAGSRLSIVSNAQVPLLPFLDRRLRYAAAGAGAGATGPVALLLLACMLRPRYGTSEEAELDATDNVPLLGVLPTLGELETDSDTQAGAAHCIHQIRVMLQVGRPQDIAPIFLLTSAAPGEGKTSLISALAISYAISGSRTLIIDGDMVGRGLTAGFYMEGMPGLGEAIAEQRLNGFASQSRTPGLWVLPAGQTGAAGASRMSLPPFQKILDQARKQFDVILIDSGPILGSVEASVIAQGADGVLFVMARGQERPLVKRAMAQVRSVGGNIVGLVFNRADAREFHRSGHLSSVRTRHGQRALGFDDAAQSWKPSAKTQHRSPRQRVYTDALGPLTRSVVADFDDQGAMD